MQNSLQSLDVSKASGPDKVSARMLKETASSIAPSITNLFNCSIRFGKLPIQWKTSMIVPIPKSTNFANPENYRPISLICILCKLLERHMDNDGRASIGIFNTPVNHTMGFSFSSINCYCTTFYHSGLAYSSRVRPRYVRHFL